MPHIKPEPEKLPEGTITGTTSYTASYKPAEFCEWYCDGRYEKITKEITDVFLKKEIMTIRTPEEIRTIVASMIDSYEHQKTRWQRIKNLF